MLGLYLATMRAELPVSVKTMINFAFTSKAVLTAEEATDSYGVTMAASSDCWRIRAYNAS